MMKIQCTYWSLSALCLARRRPGPEPGRRAVDPAAARGAGAGGSFWITDLYVMNLGEEEVDLEIAWLARGADNSEAEGQSSNRAGGDPGARGRDQRYLRIRAGRGAIHIEVVEEDEDVEETRRTGDEALSGRQRARSTTPATTARPSGRASRASSSTPPSRPTRTGDRPTRSASATTTASAPTGTASTSARTSRGRGPGRTARSGWHRAGRRRFQDAAAARPCCARSEPRGRSSTTPLCASLWSRARASSACPRSTS